MRFETTRAAAPRRRWLWLLGAALVVSAAGVLGVIVWRRSKEPVYPGRATCRNECPCCPEGEECVKPFDQGERHEAPRRAEVGFCAARCDGWTKECPPGMTCREVLLRGAPASQWGEVCLRADEWPPPTERNIVRRRLRYREMCARDEGWKCGPRAYCLFAPGEVLHSDDLGFCVYPCAADTTCPEAKTCRSVSDPDRVGATYDLCLREEEWPRPKGQAVHPPSAGP